MKFTNKFDLPQPIYDAVANDPYTKGDADYSITGLLKPPRIVALEAKHDDAIEEDISDRIFSLIGQAVHGILERSERVAIAEKRLYCTVDGKRISGQTDRFIFFPEYNIGTLQDYKVTSVWKVMGDEIDADWVRQQNAYRYLLHKNGYYCDKLQIVAFLRDWSKPKARREEEYPVAQVKVVPLPVWPLDSIESFLRERIAMHEAAKTNLPLCTDDERWATPDSWAVKKQGGKRALRVYYREEEALDHAARDMELAVEARKGQQKRCEDYCLVSQFCQQYKELSV